MSFKVSRRKISVEIRKMHREREKTVSVPLCYILAIVASPIEFYMFSSAHQTCVCVYMCVNVCVCAAVCRVRVRVCFYVRQGMVKWLKSVFYDNHSNSVYCVFCPFLYGCSVCCVCLCLHTQRSAPDTQRYS